MEPALLSDNDLVARYRADRGAASGELWAEELVRRYSAVVGRWCYSYTGDREAAADLAQDVFAKAFRYLNSFEGMAKFSTWLYTIVRREAIDCARSRMMRPEHLAESLDANYPDHAAFAAFRTVEQESTIRFVTKVLHEVLDETERTVFTLHFGDGVPLNIITQRLGLRNASGAKAYVVRAKRKLVRWSQLGRVNCCRRGARPGASLAKYLF